VPYDSQGPLSLVKIPDVIEEIDWSVGEVLSAGPAPLDDNTLVIFTSDNGPWLSYGTHAGSAGPFREGKGTAWEGGTRERASCGGRGTFRRAPSV